MAHLLAGAVLFVGYLRHGYLLLHGWHMPDAPFCPTELSQYALLEASSACPAGSVLGR